MDRGRVLLTNFRGLSRVCLWGGGPTELSAWLDALRFLSLSVSLQVSRGLEDSLEARSQSFLPQGQSQADLTGHLRSWKSGWMARTTPAAAKAPLALGELLPFPLLLPTQTSHLKKSFWDGENYHLGHLCQNLGKSHGKHSEAPFGNSRLSPGSLFVNLGPGLSGT